MHLQDTSAFNTTDPDKVYVVNQPAPNQYTATADIETITVDSDNDPFSNKYYNLVLWHSVSSGSEEEKVFINLPSGSYTKQGDATSDVSGYDNYSIPSGFRGYGFLVQRVTIKHSTGGGGTWTIIQETDLRGSVPTVAVGSGTASITTEFADSQFKLFDEGNPTRELAFQLSGISNSTVRTITVPDEDLSLIDDATSDPLIDADAAEDGTEGSLARKDHQHIKHHAKYLDSAAVAAIEAEDPLDLAGVVNIAKYHQYTEIADPGAGAANTLRVYAVDDGSGVTGLQLTDSAGVDTFIGARTRYYWLHPEDFMSIIGVPVYVMVGAWATGSTAWQFPGDNTLTGVVAKAGLPADWVSGTVKITLFYQGPGPDTNNRRFEMYASALTPGTDSIIKALDITNSQTVGSGVGSVTQLTFSTGLTVAAGDIVRITFGRDSNHADDSNPDVVYLLGVRLEYTAFF
jgi:hypothetical protein